MLKNRFPELLPQYEDLYTSEIQEHHREISKKVGVICNEYGLMDRIPRYCLNFNQRIAEKLFDMVYRIELDDPKRAWPYRKAAWAVDELDQDIRGTNLRTLPGIGEKIAALIQERIRELNTE